MITESLVKDLSEKFGGRPLVLGGSYLWPSGHTGTDMKTGLHVRISSNPIQALRSQARYHREILEMAQSDRKWIFSWLHGQISCYTTWTKEWRSVYGPCPQYPREALAILDTLITNATERLTAIERQIVSGVTGS